MILNMKYCTQKSKLVYVDFYAFDICRLIQIQSSYFFHLYSINDSQSNKNGLLFVFSSVTWFTLPFNECDIFSNICLVI